MVTLPTRVITVDMAKFGGVDTNKAHIYSHAWTYNQDAHDLVRYLSQLKQVEEVYLMLYERYEFLF